MATETIPRKPGVSVMIRQSVTAMSPPERFRVIAMYGAIVFLHLLGFFIFIAIVVPAHYKGLGIGLSLTAYTLGLRHAFDAAHISATDTTTPQALGERRGDGT